jgi:S1/P1 nuclease
VKRFIVALIVVLGLAPAVQAWNNKGHMVVARIAWKELTPEERAKVIEILKTHPHYDEFLRAERPNNIPEDEWVFMRAATWADWVRGGPEARRKYNVPKRHFIDHPFVALGSSVKPPKLDEENAVSGIDSGKKQVMTETDREKRAVAMTWIFHLVGDLAQPLHAATRYADDFPSGDKGGNSAMVRIHGGGVVRLHPFWDGLLGNAVTRTSILGTVAEIESLVADHADAIKADLESNKTPEDWAKESFKLAVNVVYEEGKLKPANADNEPEACAIPTTGEKYAKIAGETARICAYKGGKRLAQVLKDVLAEN